jgi:hypothetical protein
MGLQSEPNDQTAGNHLSGADERLVLNHETQGGLLATIICKGTSLATNTKPSAPT